MRLERGWTWAVLIGIVLGLAAFLGDLVPGPTGAVVLGLTSSGAAWGGAAAALGFSAPTARRAVALAIAALGLASFVYYLLILVVSRRWDIPNVNLETGESQATLGLTSVVRNWALFTLISVVIGAVVGLLAYVISNGSRWPASLSAGLLAGILISEGVAGIATSTAFQWTLHAGQDWTAGPAVAIILGLAVAAWLFRRRQAPKLWAVYVGATLVATVAGSLLWKLVEALRYAM